MNLMQLRKESNKKQEDIAKILNLSTTGYSYYETGKREPNIETLIKLADYYQVSLDYLVGRQFNNEVGHLTDKEKEVLKYFRMMTPENQKILAGECKGIILAQEM